MTNVVENGHASYWAKQAEGAAAKQAADMRMKMFENQLRIDLDNAKTDNDRTLAYDKYQQELSKIGYKDQLDITKDQRELGASQEQARNQWNNITFDEGDKPVSKAQTYVRKFRSILGDDVTDIRYGTDFKDEQGDTIPKGYYAVIQTTDKKGRSIEVNQLLTQGDDLKFDDVARYIDPKKQLIPSKQTDSFSDNQVLSWLANNTGDPNYQTILNIYNSNKKTD